jgi:hypothetical protein
MFTRNLKRAVRVAALVAVAAGPMWAAAQGATGPSGTNEPSGGMGAAGAAKSPGGSGGTGSSGATSAEAGKGHMPPTPAAMQKMKPSELYNMMDKDKDGYVTKEEFLKFQEHVFDTWDKNKTGKLGQVMFTDAG